MLPARDGKKAHLELEDIDSNPGPNEQLCDL